MIRVTVSKNLERVTVNVDENESMKSVLDANDVRYDVGMVSLDGATLKPGDINKSFAEMGVTERCYLSVIVKADNAADGVEGSEPAAHPVPGVIIAGSVVTIKSGFTPDELKMVQRFRPECLNIYAAENGHKEAVYSVGVAKTGDGSINSVGTSYGSRAAADGKAMVVIQIPEGVSDAKAWASDHIGVSILKLRQVEAGLAAALADIKEDQNKVNAAITML